MATEREPRLSAADFRFDRIVSSGPANRRTDACSVSARCREDGVAPEILVPEAEQDGLPQSPPAGASHDTLLDHA